MRNSFERIARENLFQIENSKTMNKMMERRVLFVYINSQIEKLLSRKL